MPSLSKRNDSIDFLKGIAIFLVVLAHCWILDREIFFFIYSFHMPLFFCISGYLFSTRKKFKDFFISKVKTLIVPYILFFIFSFVVSVTILHREITIVEGFKYFFLGGKFCANVCNWPLWYLQLFFIASCIFYFIAKIKYFVIRIIIMAVLFASSMPIQQFCNRTFENGFVPFAFNALYPALFFMLVAFEFRRIKYKLIPMVQGVNLKPLVSIVSFGLFVLGVILAAGNSDQIISLKSYTFLIYSLMILQFVVLITQNCHNKYIVYMGRNSLVILGIHRVLLFICAEILPVKELLERFSISTFAGAIIVSCLCIFVICVCNYFVKLIFRKIAKR